VCVEGARCRVESVRSFVRFQRRKTDSLAIKTEATSTETEFLISVP